MIRNWDSGRSQRQWEEPRAVGGARVVNRSLGSRQKPRAVGRTWGSELTEMHIFRDLSNGNHQGQWGRSWGSGQELMLKIHVV